MSLKDWLRYEDEIIVHVFGRIMQWHAAGYPPPQIYFTAGLERQVANMIQAAQFPQEAAENIWRQWFCEIWVVIGSLASWAEQRRAAYDQLQTVLESLRLDGVTDLGWEGVQRQNVIIDDALAISSRRPCRKCGTMYSLDSYYPLGFGYCSYQCADADVAK